MKNTNDESKKIMLGVVIGSVVGASLLYGLRKAHHQKTPALKKFGRTISEIGEMIENCPDQACSMVERVENKIPKGIEVFNQLTNWVGTGLSLWKHLKRG